LPSAAQVQGPVVGRAERSDTSKPLRELAKEKDQQDEAQREVKLDKPTATVTQFLKEKHPAALEHGQLAPLNDERLAALFPKREFFTLRFRQWPVAFEVPKGLSAGNVCVLAGDKVTLISDASQLEAFFQKQLAPAKRDDEQQAAVLAWLRISQEMHQDGFYRFEPLDEKVVQFGPDTGERVATGSTRVEPKGGNAGQITVALAFTNEGAMKSAVEKADLKEGVRPICQATKLLDADRIVRRMAERDILVMGSLALPYLLEQRALAQPELQVKMDQVWDRILAEQR
jgi:hypothetical protein